MGHLTRTSAPTSVLSRRSSRTARLALALGLAACATAQPDSQMDSTRATTGPAASTAAPNVLTAAERAAGWRLLFDGRTTNGWRGYQEQSMPAGWRVDDGVLSKSSGTNDIVTTDSFGDFELAWDWKLARGGNAGVFYRGTEEYEKVYWSAPEYQLLDDANAADGRNRLTSAGSAYGFYAAPAGVVHAADEWNSSRVVLRGAHVEHWMNGQKLLEYELWSPDWEAKLEASKFAKWPNYARAHRGVIAIQGDHNGALALRNIKVRALQ